MRFPPLTTKNNHNQVITISITSIIIYYNGVVVVNDSFRRVFVEFEEKTKKVKERSNFHSTIGPKPPTPKGQHTTMTHATIINKMLLVRATLLFKRYSCLELKFPTLKFHGTGDLFLEK